MAKLADLTRIQRLWTKIKNTFVAKNDAAHVASLKSYGNATVASLSVQSGENNPVAGVTSEGNARVKDLDVGGDAHFENDITLAGSITSESGGATLNDDVNIKGGYSVVMYNEGNSKHAEMYCNDDGKVVGNGGVLATVTDVTTAVANAPHLTREKVTTLPGVATAKENVIYLVPAGDGSGDDVFDEYMLIGGKMEKMGSSRIDLSGYSTTEQMNSAINTAVTNSYTLITDAEIDALE